MFPAQDYYTIYALIVGLLIFIKIISGTIIKPDYSESSKIWVALIGIFFILFFGFKPWRAGDIMGDTAYPTFYNWIQNGTLSKYFQIGSLNGKIDYFSELGFNYPRTWMALNGIDVSIWLTYVASIYIIPIIIAIKRLFKDYEYTAFLFFLSCYIFYGYGLNGIRNGDGFSLFILGISYLITQNRNLLLGILFLTLSFYFHHSLAISIIAFLLAYFLIKRTNLACYIWVGTIILTLTFENYLANSIVGFGLDDRADYYLAASTNLSRLRALFSHVGFRWDFVIYSIIPIILGWYVTVIRRIEDRTYQILLNTYILANAIWIIFMYAAFTNRYAALSWSLYPFVLCYPLLKFKIWGKQQKTYAAFFLTGQFILTLIF